MRTVLFAALLLVAPTVAAAEAPQVPTQPPYIVLSDNHDEPNGYGFCIDTYSRGLTDLAHTHTCKPAAENRARDNRDNDTRFFFDADTGQVASYAFDGICLQVLRAGERTVFALLECDDHPRQRFNYDTASGTLSMAEDPGSCVTVASETVPAGPWVKRALLLQACDDVESSLKRWTVVAD